MNYDETLAYLYSQLPMFQRIGPAAYKANLDNTLALCKILGNPETKIRAIHVAGTNGKGSVSHMLASILQEAGYRTGLFTSPHLTDFRERIRINGKMIPQEYVIEFVEKYQGKFREIQPSFFEMTAGMAFKYFSDESTGICVIETGMGGRLDSTNVIMPEISVITNISKDHTQFLGDTREKIAAEKAGIIKPNIPVIIGESNPETDPVFMKKAKETASGIFFADQEFSVLENGEQSDGKNEGTHADWLIRSHESKTGKPLRVRVPFGGSYQKKNLITVLQSIRVLTKNGFQINDAHIIRGIENTIKNTGIRGRWQILNNRPMIVCDIGHNEEGIREVVAMINRTKHARLHMVFGTVNDKNVLPVLDIMPSEATYYFCKADIPRAMDAEKLKNQAHCSGLEGGYYDSVKAAIDEAIRNAAPEDMIMIGGSTFVVAEALQYLENE